MGLTVLTVRRGGGFLYQDKLLLLQRDTPPRLRSPGRAHLHMWRLLWVQPVDTETPQSRRACHGLPLPVTCRKPWMDTRDSGISPWEKKHSYLAFFIAFATQSNFCRTCRWERRGPGPARGSEWWGLSLGGLRSPPSLGGAVCWGDGPVSACLGDAFSTGRPASPSSQVGGSLCLTHAEPTASEGHVLSAGVGSGRCPERL